MSPQSSLCSPLDHEPTNPCHHWSQPSGNRGHIPITSNPKQIYSPAIHGQPWRAFFSGEFPRASKNNCSLSRFSSGSCKVLEQWGKAGGINTFLMILWLHIHHKENILFTSTLTTWVLCILISKWWMYRGETEALLQWHKRLRRRTLPGTLRTLTSGTLQGTWRQVLLMALKEMSEFPSQAFIQSNQQPKQQQKNLLWFATWSRIRLSYWVFLPFFARHWSP